MILHRMNGFPDGLASIELARLGDVFEGPTLIEIGGGGKAPLFVSVLLHGNETTSFYVLRALAARYGKEAPPRPLLIFVGNVRAAVADRRFLEGEPDFNRIWRGGESPHEALAAEVVEAARKAGVFASIDIHNNTGRNPHYGCVNSLRAADLYLASLFAPIGVHYLIPNTTQSMAFSQFCPAMTIECGQSGDEAGVAKALALVETVMRLEEFPALPPEPSALQLFETVGRVVINPARSFAFGVGDADLILADGLEAMNFREAQAGFRWAPRLGAADALAVVNEHGDDLTAEFFESRDAALFLKQAVVPAMISADERAVRQDCLCYLMKPIAA